MKVAKSILLALLSAFACSFCADAAVVDEFKVKREEVFEFTQQPAVTREGDKISITFASKAWCDVTVAIEDAEGHILRHLASGVLGPKVPVPFQKESLKQTIVWDSKNDHGDYVEDLDRITIRVALGLKPQFERTLFWSPHKRMANACPLLIAKEEGVLMFEGRGVDQLRLYDHEGNYVRTAYPFPAGKLKDVAGVEERIFPQDGAKLPVKHGFVQASLLTSGTSALLGLPYKFGDGFGATAMAASGNHVAVGFDQINRLGLDGTSGGLNLTGAKIGQRAKWSGYGGQGGGDEIIGPSSMAFSPDGKSLYLTGYFWREFYQSGADCLHCVRKLTYDQDAEPTIFVGQMKTDQGAGSDAEHFTVPTSVDCDAKGRVYVTDALNDRIQIFSPDAKLLKTVATPKPVKVLVNPKNGELWVFSWPIVGASNKIAKEHDFQWDKVKPTLRRYGPMEDPKPISTQPLPFDINLTGFFLTGPLASVAVDWWAPSPTLWAVARKHNISRIDVAWGGVGAYERRDHDPWMNDGVRILVEKDGQWQIKRNFADDAKSSVVQMKPADFARQRLAVNPRDGKLYVLEDSGFSKSFYRMPQIDPLTGKVQMVEIPFDAEDICFDQEGLAYLRTDTLVARYDSHTWREVPWDYGEEHKGVGFTSLGGSKRADVLSAIATPGVRPVCWNQGGMSVSPKGNLIISCTSRAEESGRKDNESPWERSRNEITGKPYTPRMFPGRVRWQEIHVWDAHGTLVAEDAVPGLGAMNGAFMDRNDSIYVMASPTRVLDDDKPYWNEMTGTMVKFRPKEGKVISSSSVAAVPLAKEAWPNRAFDLIHGRTGKAWVEGAEWCYGGVGWDGFNPSHSGGGCDCWNSRFSLDYFARSFAPEIDHYSVAVLDSSGNLILRIGKYGNVDDGKPLVADGGPGNAQSIGGDEVALFHACYVAAYTDRRLFIADAGNSRILSVKLGYHTEQKLALKDVPPRGLR